LSRILIVALISSILIVGCGDDGSLNGAAHSKILLLLAPSVQQAKITRVVLRVSGSDMETMEFELDVDDDGKTASGIILIPCGKDRLFTVTAYSGDGVEAKGEELVALVAPGESMLEMALKPAKDLPPKKVLYVVVIGRRSLKASAITLQAWIQEYSIIQTVIMWIGYSKKTRCVLRHGKRP